MGKDISDRFAGKTVDEVRAAIDSAAPYAPTGTTKERDFLHVAYDAGRDGDEPPPDERPFLGEEIEQAIVPIQSSAEFVRGFVPPDYLVDGILQRGFLYSLTGPTGGGKTAIALRLMACTALGRVFGGCEAEKGRCVMFVGENPDDVRARWIALSEQMGFDADEIDVTFVPGVFSIPELKAQLDGKGREFGGFALVVVDTSAAYFAGDEENSNKELGDHARMLRRLTQIPGRPCVVVNCHPVKNAAADNLIPRGGGAFIAEVDGNLCCSKSETVVELHWAGKFRGPDFSPIAFEMVTVTSARLVNSKGKLMPTVIARPLSESEQANKEDASNRDLQKLLVVMADNAGASIAAIASELGWVSATGLPNKAKVQRLMTSLKKQRLADKVLNAWTLTPAGTKAAKRGAK